MEPSEPPDDVKLERPEQCNESRGGAGDDHGDRRPKHSRVDRGGTKTGDDSRPLKELTALRSIEVNITVTMTISGGRDDEGCRKTEVLGHEPGEAGPGDATEPRGRNCAGEATSRRRKPGC